jgi:hypothetical protein
VRHANHLISLLAIARNEIVFRRYMVRILKNFRRAASNEIP